MNPNFLKIDLWSLKKNNLVPNKLNINIIYNHSGISDILINFINPGILLMLQILSVSGEKEPGTTGLNLKMQSMDGMIGIQIGFFIRI